MRKIHTYMVVFPQRQTHLDRSQGILLSRTCCRVLSSPRADSFFLYILFTLDPYRKLWREGGFRDEKYIKRRGTSHSLVPQSRTKLAREILSHPACTQNPPPSQFIFSSLCFNYDMDFYLFFLKLHSLAVRLFFRPHIS